MNTRLNLYSIPKDKMREMQLAADLAWRGIKFPPCTQQPARSDAVAKAAEPVWGRVNNFQTELGEFYSHATK